MLELIELEYYLEEILQLKIDLVTRNGIKPQLRDSILSEVVYV
jgi:predicted nucleotidyltransferase